MRQTAAVDPSGSVALVTGASSGIGRASALRLAGAGARLLLTGRDECALAEVAAATGGRVLPADLAEPKAVHELAAAAREAGPVDVLLHSAGLGWKGPLDEMDAAALDRLLDVNLRAPLLLTRLLLPDMLSRRRGQVVLVTSIAGLTGVPEESVYAATKGGLELFAASLRAEVEGRGVRVSTVAPGVVATEFFARRGAPYHRQHPRPVSPERVADAVLHAVRHGRPSYVVPRWLGVPARLRGGLPGVYRTLAARFGE